MTMPDARASSVAVHQGCVIEETGQLRLSVDAHQRRDWILRDMFPAWSAAVSHGFLLARISAADGLRLVGHVRGSRLVCSGEIRPCDLVGRPLRLGLEWLGNADDLRRGNRRAERLDPVANEDQGQREHETRHDEIREERHSHLH